MTHRPRPDEQIAPAPSLAALMPPGVVVGARKIFPTATPEYPAEAEAVARAVPARRAEFVTGRALVRDLLESLGAPRQAIGVGHRRAPLWPTGFTASIAHAGSLCIAAAAPAGAIAALGIDLEPDQALEEGLVPMLATNPELRAVAAALPAAHPSRVVFCIKEAFFKAQYPLTGAELEFEQVRIRAGSRPEELTLDLAGAPSPSRALSPRVNVRAARSNGWLTAAAWIAPA